MNNADAIAELQSFITKVFRVTTRDGRIFVGYLKCTDRDQNIVLSKTHEYRLPKPTMENIGLKLDLQSRFLGLIVVMGVDIVKVEVEESGSGIEKDVAMS